MNATEHLSIMSSFAWNSSSQQTAPTLAGNSGVPVSLFPTDGLGSTLAQSPPFQGNIRIRYDVPFGQYAGYGQVAAQHTAHSYASVVTAGAFESPRQDQHAHTTYDAAVGTNKDAWGVELYGEDLTDTRAQLYVDGFDFVHLVTVNRPRTLRLRIAYKF